MDDFDFTNDYRNSSCFSKITFFWTSRLIAHTRKYKKIDDNAKLMAMSKDWDTEAISNNIENMINDEKSNNPEFQVKAKINRIVAKAFKKDLIFLV